MYSVYPQLSAKIQRLRIVTGIRPCLPLGHHGRFLKAFCGIYKFQAVKNEMDVEGIVLKRTLNAKEFG